MHKLNKTHQSAALTFQQHYQNWIQEQNWEFFFTGTYRRMRSIHSARRDLEKFFEEFTAIERLFGVVEVGRMYGRVHVHGIFRFEEFKREYPETIWRYWFKKHGRASVEKINSIESVGNYCTKYLQKELNHENYIIL